MYKESKKKIYVTTDYDEFVFTDWNRDVSNARVVKMVESISKCGWLPQPVLVNEKMEVIDGQSRVKALEVLGMPVEFCIEEGIGRTECQMLNLFQKNWTTKNYINSYIADNNDNYIWLRDILIKYKDLPQTVVMNIAASKGDGKNCGGQYLGIINEGRFVINAKEKKYVDNILFYLTRFAETITYIGGRKDTFYAAVKFMYQLEDLDHERLCTVVNNARYDGIVSSSTVEGWLQQFEILYNKGVLKAKRVDVMHEYKIA